MAYSMIWQRKNLIVARNHEYKDTDSVNSVESGLFLWLGVRGAGLA